MREIRCVICFLEDFLFYNEKIQVIEINIQSNVHNEQRINNSIVGFGS